MNNTMPPKKKQKISHKNYEKPASIDKKRKHTEQQSKSIKKKKTEGHPDYKYCNFE